MNMTEISVSYPLVMKMSIITSLKVTPKATLAEIQKGVFDNFWKEFGKKYATSQHGSPKFVTLYVGDTDVEILTDQQLQHHLKTKDVFNAIFVKHSS